MKIVSYSSIFIWYSYALQTLTTLNLRMNFIYADGARYLANALTHNRVRGISCNLLLDLRSASSKFELDFHSLSRYIRSICFWYENFVVFWRFQDMFIEIGTYDVRSPRKLYWSWWRSIFGQCINKEHSERTFFDFELFSILVIKVDAHNIVSA